MCAASHGVLAGALRRQQRRSDGSWKTLSKTYGTQGSSETRTVDLGKGTYRAVVSARYGYQGATSAAVTLVR